MYLSYVCVYLDEYTYMHTSSGSNVGTVCVCVFASLALRASSVRSFWSWSIKECETYHAKNTGLNHL